LQRKRLQVNTEKDKIRPIPNGPVLVPGAEASVTTDGSNPESSGSGWDASSGHVTLLVNGEQRHLAIGPEVTLLDALRERLNLTGAKKGCDLGQCGACTVLMDSKRVNSCLVLAVRAQGKQITTIEGLARDGQLHPLQQAFVDQDAFQCGYCTPGQIISGVALINEGRAHDEAEIRKHMSGNLCRCGAYANIIAAIQQAAGQV
jgi:xanthine dehydrogenase YagT iron-sulfur-binding subunit